MRDELGPKGSDVERGGAVTEFVRHMGLGYAALERGIREASGRPAKAAIVRNASEEFGRVMVRLTGALRAAGIDDGPDEARGVAAVVPEADAAPAKVIPFPRAALAEGTLPGGALE